MRLIGVKGYKGSGKDTVYKFVNELLPDKTVQRAAFADKVKIISAKALGFDRDDDELLALMDSFKQSALISVDYTDPEQSLTYERLMVDGKEAPVARIPIRERTQHDLTGREYLEFFGDRCRGVFGENFWVDQVLPKPSTHPSSGVRQASGAQRLETQYPGVDVLVITDARYENELVRIAELGGEVWQIEGRGEPSEAPTERPVPRELIDIGIDNDGTLDDLRERVAEALNV